MAPSGTSDDNPGNFANRPKEEVQAIASKGGQSSYSGGFASMDPTSSTLASDNPGNFANRPKEDAQEAGHKGGSK
ncbi:hypothetical protein BKA67DRAFT_664607 [Truncatella angustata]|uniref:Conidiation-specific protein 10 n=1 Tax=Truncatella angustata TaxID=152316 RepID=A0A9P8RJQ0_9PEZI|nr:uncharacterized protein BKA67DRAFT_664607 [Truncatella angustata]KAH6645538.1 hypothetical protein BKA67DRAFT_664607 [Truncatella angustata]KAH8193739.1 hypothetical protein TruAng_012093 [Truncatella angustata]